MIAWGSFLVVLCASLLAGCGAVTLFSFGLRFAGPETVGRRRVVGVACFILCGLLAVLGVCLVVPAFAPFFASL